MGTKLSSKGMLLDLCSQRSRWIQLKDKLSAYKEIIDFLTAKDYYKDEYLSIPTVKEISIIKNITTHKLYRDLKKRYNEVSSYETTDDYPFIMRKTIVGFNLKGTKNSMTIYVDGLKRIPNKGESIRIPYFKEYLETNYFFVLDVDHQFHDDEHHVIIMLKRGFYNSYWEIRKDQAFAIGELGLFDNMKEDDELKNKLKISSWNAWRSF